MSAALITNPTQLAATDMIFSDGFLANDSLAIIFPINGGTTSNANEYMTAAVPSRFGTALGAIVAFLFIIFGLFGDSLILIAILRKRELRTNLVNIFIVSLQLNDIFNISFNQFLVGLAYIFMKFHGPYIICEIFVYTSIICTGSLLWHHALIAVHRYLVVVCNQSTSFMGMSPRLYITLSLVFARLIPTLVCAPALIQRNMTVYSEAALRCLLAPRVSGFQNLLIVVINMLVPCVIVVFCFARIFTKVHRVSRNIHKSIQSNYNFYIPSKIMHQTSQDKSAAAKPIPQQPQPQSQSPTPQSRPLLGANLKAQHLERSSISRGATVGADGVETGTPVPSSPMNSIVMANMSNSNNVNLFTMTMNSMHREIQITKMFAIIFTVFLFGYLPYGIIRMLDKKNSLHPDVYVLLTVLFIISISVSPVIYGLMNNQIRVQCTKLLKIIFDCKKNATKNRSFRTSCYATTGLFARDVSDDCMDDVIRKNLKKRESNAARLANGGGGGGGVIDRDATKSPGPFAKVTTEETRTVRSFFTATNGDKSDDIKSTKSKSANSKKTTANTKTTTNGPESVSPSKSSKETLTNKLIINEHPSIYDNVSTKSTKNNNNNNKSISSKASKSLNSNEPSLPNSPKDVNPSTIPTTGVANCKRPFEIENDSDEEDGGVYKGPPGWLQ